MAKNNNTPLIILAVVLLVLVGNMETGTFILYGGVEIEVDGTDILGDCWTLADDRCVRQKVNMLNLTSTGFLICPELYYFTEIDCKRSFNLIEQVREAKLNCYYVQDDVCLLEQFEEKCPATYFQTKEACEVSLVDFVFSTKALFSNKDTLIFIGIGAVALLLIIVNVMRKR